MFISLTEHPSWLSAAILAAVAGLSARWVWPRVRARDARAPKCSRELLRTTEKLPPSPLLSLPADAKLTQSVLASALHQQCDAIFTSIVTVDAINIVVEGVSTAATKGEIIYKFSEHAMELYRRGEATIAVHAETNKFLPLMQDSSGKILEQAKGTLAAAPQLAQVLSLVVSAAHLIAGHDLSQRVKKLQKSVDFLIAGRTIDKKARLDRYFIQARGELAKPITELRQSRLSDISYSLAQLRMEWRGEIEALIEVSDHLESTKWWHLRTKSSNKGIQRELTDAAPIIGQKLESIGSALLIEAMLALSTNSLDELRNNTLTREVTEWAELDSMCQRMVVHFSGKRLAETSQIAAGVADYLTIVRQLRHDPFGSTNEEVDLAPQVQGQYVAGPAKGSAGTGV